MFLQQKTLKYVEKIQGTDRKICTSGSRGIRPLTIQPIFFQLIFGMLNFVADVESQKFWLKNVFLNDFCFNKSSLAMNSIAFALLSRTFNFFLSLFVISFSLFIFIFFLSFLFLSLSCNSFFKDQLSCNIFRSFLSPFFFFFDFIPSLSSLSSLSRCFSPFSLVFLSSQMQQISIMTKSFPVFMPFNVTNKFQLCVYE